MNNISPKVTSGALAGAFTVILVWILGSLGVSVPPEVSAAIAMILSSAVGYLTPDKFRQLGQVQVQEAQA